MTIQNLCQINYADVIMITEKAPHTAGSVLPYSRDSESDRCHQPWKREAHFRPVCEGFFMGKLNLIENRSRNLIENVNGKMIESEK